MQGEIPPLCVLIVDDEEILVRELSNLILKNKKLNLDDAVRSNIKVLSANNGLEALEILRREKSVNLILLDILMPMMDGYEICKTLRRNPDFSHCRETPIFFISGAVRDTTEQLKGLELEADQVFSKPFEPLLIGNYIKKELRRQILQYQRSLAENSRRLFLLMQERAQKQNVFHFVSSHTYSHSARVEVLSTLIGSSPVLALNPAEAYCLKEMVRDHDKGKIGIPEEILNKPGVLADSEISIIRMHTAISAILLNAEATTSFSPAVWGELFHHEMYLGDGYPTGRPLFIDNNYEYIFHGETYDVRLNLLVSIVSCADALDAITSKRPYKDPMTFYEATQVLVEYTIVHFHPLVVEALFERLSTMESSDVKKIDHETTPQIQGRYAYFQEGFRMLRESECFREILRYYEQDSPAPDGAGKYAMIRSLFYDGVFTPYFNKRARELGDEDPQAAQADPELEALFKKQRELLLAEDRHNPLVVNFIYLEIGCSHRLLSFRDIEALKTEIMPLVDGIAGIPERAVRLSAIYDASLILFVLETCYYMEYLDLNNVQEAEHLYREYNGLENRLQNLRAEVVSLKTADYTASRAIMREYYSLLLEKLDLSEEAGVKHGARISRSAGIAEILSRLGASWKEKIPKGLL